MLKQSILTGFIAGMAFQVVAQVPVAEVDGGAVNENLLSGVPQHIVMEHWVPDYTSCKKAIPQTVSAVFGAEAFEELKRLTDPAFANHPEYGTLPYRTPCDSCFELIHDRTPTTRQFVEVGTNGQTYYHQVLYGFYHYQDRNGLMRTIDPRLTPDPDNPGLFQAMSQSIPTKYNKNEGSSTMILSNGVELIFNKQIKVYHLNNNQITDLGQKNITNTTVGQDGAYTNNILNNIDRTITYKESEIKTNYILKVLPNLNSTTGWLVFEDEIVLPAGYSIERDVNTGFEDSSGYWQGDLVVVGPDEEVLATFETPGMYDSGNTNTSKFISYDIEKNGSTYTISTMVDVNWLFNSVRVYPIIVDPLISGSNTYSGGVQGYSDYAPGIGFCGTSSNFCSYFLTVTCCGGGQITDVLWSARSETRCISNPCDCKKDEAGHRFVGPCGQSPIPVNNWWSCNTGCTNGPQRCGGCEGINYSSPNLATCLVPQCANYVILFEKRNIYCNVCNGCNHGNCSTACHYDNNNTWTMTIQARTVEQTATANAVAVSIIGSCNVPFTIAANANFGVPAYAYLWSTGQTVPSFADSQGANGLYTYTCTVTDQCGNTSVSTVQVLINDCPLPIELLNLNGAHVNDQNIISWATGSEVNSDHFELYRSLDGTDFEMIGKIAAAGNSSKQLNYQYIDHWPPTGINYYKLKLVDRDGATSWSDAIAIAVQGSWNLNIFPNPATSEVIIGFEYDSDSKGDLKVVDLMGKLIVVRQVTAINGSNQLKMDLTGFAQGMYYVTLNIGGAVYSAKMLKK